MSTETQDAIRDLQARIGAINTANGWRNAPPPPGFEATQAIAVLALIGTEVSEAIEELRNGHGFEAYYPHHAPGCALGDYRVYGSGHTPAPACTCTPKPEGVPSELADIVIRALDFADARKIDLGAVIEEKIAYNATRGHRHGGKSL